MCLDTYLKEKITKCFFPFFIFFFTTPQFYFLLFSKSLLAPNKQALVCSKA